MLLVTLLMTHSYIGGLLLGVMLTSSEEAQVLTRGLQCLMDLIPESAFYVRGTKGPEVFKTDDSKMERGALQTVFSKSRLILCIFHILKAFYEHIRM